MGREATKLRARTVSGRFDVGFRLPLTSPKSSAPPFGSTHKICDLGRKQSGSESVWRRKRNSKLRLSQFLSDLLCLIFMFCAAPLRPFLAFHWKLPDL
jgi:hypothetical protein